MAAIWRCAVTVDSEAGARYYFNGERRSDPEMTKGIAAAERKVISASFGNDSDPEET
jgi:hypothetical protein